MATNRRTKIVGTLGPATSTPEMIEALIRAGLDVARVNASHGSQEGHRELIQTIRAVAQKVGRPVGILFDLQGPKIRIGKFNGPPREVKPGDIITICVRGDLPEGALPTDYPLLDKDVSVGQPLLIDDGEIATEVCEVADGLVRCKVLNEGSIAQRKGINLPASNVSAPALSEKDRADALFAADHGVDAIALSFVRQASDVVELRELLASHGHDVPIVAKIEKPQAIQNLGAILREAWGVMVARGDLGVELPLQEVPMVQKEIIAQANRLAKPVITATQMLDSMRRSPRPTRAEASDVANAVLDGTDAVMLSGETAVGRYPVESVQMMDRIVKSTERDHYGAMAELRSDGERKTVAEATARASVQVARNIQARAVVAFTRTGATAIMLSERRSPVPLLAFTPEEHSRNRLTLVWGVRPYLLPNTKTVDERVRLLEEAVLREGLANKDDYLVLCMAAPTARAGSTNIMMVHKVGAVVAAKNFPAP